MTDSGQTNNGTQMTLIDIRRLLWRMFQRWYAFVLAAAIFASCGYIYAKMSYIPVYQSKIMLALSPKFDEEGNISKNTDWNSALKLAQDCKYMLGSDRVLNAVSEKLGRDISSETLQSVSSVNVQTNSSFVEVSIQTHNREETFQLAQAVEESMPDFIQETLTNYTVTVTNSAKMPTIPSSGGRTRTFVALGVLLGVVLTAALIVLMDVLRDTIRSAKDLSQRLNTRLLGSIPLIKRRHFWDQKPTGLLISTRQVSFSFIESFKSVRTRVETICEKENLRCILVTSALENEGKTTASANLAIALAQNLKSVLIVDADLRKPALHTLFDEKMTEQKGLIQILNGKSNWRDVMIWKQKFGVHAIFSGGTSENSSELLGLPAMADFLHEVRDSFDYVIVDTPPTHIVSDTPVLTGVADGVLLVVREDFAHTTELIDVIDSLELKRARLIGAILNQTDSPGGYGGYRGRSYYKYDRRYGYGSDKH